MVQPQRGPVLRVELTKRYDLRERVESGEDKLLYTVNEKYVTRYTCT